MGNETTLDAPAGLLEDLEALETVGVPRPSAAPWRPSTLVDVDWLLETMAEIDAEAAENQTLADVATQRILERLDKANGVLKRRRDYLEALARQYATEHRAEIIRGKAKSRTLPNGALAWRKTGGRLVVKDEKALLEWALAREAEHPEFVRRKPEPAIAEIWKFCIGPDGRGVTIPPGTQWEEPDEYGKLDVKPAEKALAKMSG